MVRRWTSPDLRGAYEAARAGFDEGVTTTTVTFMVVEEGAPDEDPKARVDSIAFA